ncbi:MAG: nitrogenase component 1 [Oscillospiraceae bacterium]|nr:nitrogenase component 1 [Oscillospiraceae bacterium]
MKPGQGCFYLGAYRAFVSVKDAFLLVHSVSGCSWGALALRQMGRQDDVRQAGTMVHEREIVFGGEGKLREALEILKARRPKRVFVLNGCPTDMIRDDIEGVIRQAACPFPVHWFNTAGYRGSMREGYIAAMCRLVPLLEDGGKRDPRAVNLVGISADDYRGETDLAAIRKMLEPETRLNAALPMLTEEGIRRWGEAGLNIVFRGFEAVGEALKQRFGTAYITVDYPYGAEGSAVFLRAVDEALGADHGETIRRGTEAAADLAEKVVHPLRLLYQAEAAVAGDHMRASAMRRFLQEELGLRIAAYRDDLDPHEDGERWLEAVRDSGAVLVFGSAFERQLEDELPLRLIRFAYPVMDAVALGYQPYAGFDGLAYLLSDILNGVLAYPYRRRGQFEP